MDTAPPSSSSPHLEWSNVGFGLAFVVMNVALSQALQLQIGTSLVISALRCTVQLTVVATILQRVFAAHNIWTVAAIACTSHTPSFHSRGSGTRDALEWDASALEYAWHARNWCVLNTAGRVQMLT